VPEADSGQLYSPDKHSKPNGRPFEEGAHPRITLFA
jgi:hypothetical protein